MPAIYTTAVWIPKPGEDEAFTKAWDEFATWAHTMRGAGTLRLTRDLDEPNRYVSFGRWEDAESAHDWKAHPEFRERMAKVQAHVRQFNPDELELIRTIGDEGSA